jgi:hypothetical protein
VSYTFFLFAKSESMTPNCTKAPPFHSRTPWIQVFSTLHGTHWSAGSSKKLGRVEYPSRASWGVFNILASIKLLYRISLHQCLGLGNSCYQTITQEDIYQDDCWHHKSSFTDDLISNKNFMGFRQKLSGPAFHPFFT